MKIQNVRQKRRQKLASEARRLSLMFSIPVYPPNLFKNTIKYVEGDPRYQPH